MVNLMPMIVNVGVDWVRQLGRGYCGPLLDLVGHL